MAFLFISGNALAQQGFYGSVGYGTVDVTSKDMIMGGPIAVPLGGTTLGRFTGDDSTLRIQGGYRINKYFGVEGTWQDYGDPGPFNTGIFDEMGDYILADIDTSILQIATLGFLPIGQGVFEVFGRAGVSFVDEDLRFSGFPLVVAPLQVYNTNRDERNALFTYGVGVQLNLLANKNLITRVEWEQTRGEVMDRYDYAGITVGFNFGGQ